MSARPPRLLALVARVVVRGSRREFVLGDLEELYARRVGSGGRLRAALGYIRGVAGSAGGGGGRSGRRARRPTRPGQGSPIENLIGDLRQALRSLVRRPAFTLLLAATVALGMGPTIAMLSVVEQVLARPLPGARNSAEAAYLRLLDPGSEMMEFAPTGLTLQQFHDLRAETSLLAGLASYGNTGQQVQVGDARPIRISANTIYGDFFEVLGVQPSDGRLISADETSLDQNPLVAVISEDLRDRLFGPEGEAVGRLVRMNGQPVEILGVAGGGFRGPVRGEPQDAWLPHGALVPLVDFRRETLESPRSMMHTSLVALPREGVRFDSVERQVDEILARMAVAHPTRAEVFLRLVPEVVGGLHAPPTGRERTYRTLGMMTLASVLLLTIACANVASLLLFQNLARRGAFATLRALGASTGRVARQHLTRSVLVAGLGLTVGVSLASAIGGLFRGQLLLGMPAYEGFVLNPTLVAWVGAVLLATTLLFGVLPAVLAGRFDLADALRGFGAREGGRLGRLRTALSASQIGLTLALSVGGLLMLRTIQNLHAVDTGVDVHGVVGAFFEADDDLSPEEWHVLQREILERVAAEPGVEGAALDMFGPHGSQSLARVGLPGDPEDQRPRTLVWQVSPGWFELFGLSAVAGRTFEDGDWRVPPTDAAVLTASLARRLFGSVEAVGRTIDVQGEPPRQRRVVGVVRDYTSFITVTAATPEEALRPAGPTDAVFVPHAAMRGWATVFAKMDPRAEGVPARVRAAVESVIPDAPSSETYLLQDRVDVGHAEARQPLGHLSY